MKTRRLDFIVSLDKESAQEITKWIINYEIPTVREYLKGSAPYYQKYVWDNGRYEQFYLELYDLYKENQITSDTIKKLVIMCGNGILLPFPLKDSLSKGGLILGDNRSGMHILIERAMDRYEQAVQDYLNGKDKALGVIVGDIMKENPGKYNPKEILENLQKQVIEK